MSDQTPPEEPGQEPAQQPARTDLQLVIPDSTRLQVLELHNGERLIGRIVEIRDAVYFPAL